MGCVYGPNKNNLDFFWWIKYQKKELGIFIKGGDTNTILENYIGLDNLDRNGEGSISNIQNSRE
jgi:hypothetical protein